ncbi:hypothetical protein [Streptomyces halobius]|uniref:Membrane protein YkgB n=1 Tax=Streptomyces halobius TaxID=2879846 RepID=A0ABY4M247_9ACTN|nr:hypothetical protein [Streptomyces halobius]UQA91293.1 hypothetical protein K9S39_04835 [Streptomyces halobius]
MAVLKERPHAPHMHMPHMPHVISEPELRPLDLGGLLARGAAAGFFAGMGFLLANMWYAVSQGMPGISPLYAMSTVFHASDMPVANPTEAILGLTVHIGLSLGFGMGFALLLVPLLRNVPALVLGALVYGLALYMLNFQILGRTVFEFFTSPQGPDQLFEALVHPLIFGLLLVPFFLGRPFERARRAQPQPTATATGGTTPGTPYRPGPTEP